MKPAVSWKYRLARSLGRGITRCAALCTFGEMPPFVSTSALVRVDDKMLVVIDPIRQEPIIPGGHLKWRETPEEALVREVREETGFHIDPGKLVAVYAGEEWAGERGIVRIVYEGTIVGGALRSSQEGETMWWPLADLAASNTRDSGIVQRWLDTQRGSESPTRAL